MGRRGRARTLPHVGLGLVGLALVAGLGSSLGLEPGVSAQPPSDFVHYRRLDLETPWGQRRVLVTLPRRADRGIIVLGDECLALARKKFGHAGYRTAINLNLDLVLANLSDPEVKKGTWFRELAINVYRDLAQFDLVRSYEVYREDQLCGALVGITLPPLFVADTMFGLPNEKSASKAALCLMWENLTENGFNYVDTQTVHPKNHIAARVGEQRISYEDFLELSIPALNPLTKAWK